jgi:hypothetical protein
MGGSDSDQLMRAYNVAVLNCLQSAVSDGSFEECAALLLNHVQRLPIWQVALPVISCLSIGGTLEDGSALASGWLACYQASEILDHVEDKEFIEDRWASSPEVAINLATGLIFLAYRFLSLIHDPEKVRQVARIFSESGLSAAYGQQRALKESLKSVNKALDNYWELIILKAGSVFHAATAGGAVAGGADEKYLAALGDYGTALGVMLQLIDDCRDVLSPSQKAPTWEVSLPLLLYLMLIGEERIYFPEVDSRVELAALFKEVGVIDAISSLLLEWKQRALASLGGLVESAEKRLLEIIPSLFLESLNDNAVKVLDGNSRRP